MNIRDSFAEKTFLLSISVACILFFAKDNLGVNVPSILFLVLFCGGMFFYRKKEFIALGTCLPLFCNGLQIVIVMCIGIIIYVFKYGLKLRKIHLVMILLIFLELTHLFVNPFEWIGFFRHAVSFIYLGLMLGELPNAHNATVAYIMKRYIVIYLFVMIDILVQFINEYGSIMFFVTSGVRFGYVSRTEGMEFGTLFNNENMIALYSMIAIGCGFSLLFMNQKKSFSIVTILLSAFFGFATGSRSFLGTFVIIVFLAWCIFIKDKKQNLTNKIILSIIIIIGSITLYFTLFSDVINNVVLRFSERLGGNIRSNIFTDYNNYFWNNPQFWLTGIGLQEVNVKTEIKEVMHNGIQETYVCLGAVGVLLAVIIICDSIKNARRSRRSKISLKNLLLVIPYFVFIQFMQFLRLSEVFLILIIVFYSMCYTYSSAVENKD